MRKSGILLHISSLPNDYGIGTMGHEAYEFVDYLKKCGQTVWQILPLSQTSFGDSPYQSFSIYAGNPYFISLETLEKEGLLAADDYAFIKWRKNERYVDYDIIYENIFDVFRKAYERFIKKHDHFDRFKVFCQKNVWLEDYSLFMALKDAHNGRPWNEWESSIRFREAAAVKKACDELSAEMDFYKFLQFKFFEQWFGLKQYANENGVEIIGDIPIYTAYDSADVWCAPELFQLNSDRLPTVVAGFPPDGFSPKGQLWGNPIYNWDKMKEDEFEWWTERIAFAKKIYDVVRIDHFIGFDRYYAIPFGNADAIEGEWRDGPKYPLFNVIKEKTGKGGIIAEDLGIITPSVRKLLRQASYPGMKIMQFAFDADGKSEYLPQNNYVVYTSTHDNDTVAGWIMSADRSVRGFAKEYLGVTRYAQVPKAVIKLAWTSTADTAITTISDLCGYGSEARINIPSTLGGNNWRWRTAKADFSEENAAFLKRLTQLSNRIVNE